MRSPFLAAVLSLLLLGLFADLASAAQQPGKSPMARGRAIWVWQSNLLADPQGLIDFCKDKGIHTVFLFSSTRRLRSNPRMFRKFLVRAHRKRISVHALNGEPDWVQPEARDDNVPAFFNTLLAFNASGKPAERFDAVHLDVEPYSLPAWDHDHPQELAHRYVELLEWSHQQAVRNNMPLAVDVPPSFANVQLGGVSLLERTFAIADQVVVMLYGQDEESVLKIGRQLLLNSSSEGTNIWIGLSADPRHINGSSRQDLQRRLEAFSKRVEYAFGADERMLGIAIHDYQDYRALY